MKIIILILFFVLLFTNLSIASQVTVPNVFQTNDTVTNVKLNSNNNAITNVINGGLDNTNANTTSGYHFFQSVGSLPLAGNQGSVYFLTTDNSLNFDTGAAFNKSVSVNSPVNGDMVYYNSGWNRLATSATTGTPIISNGTLPVYGTITATSTVNGSSLTSLSSTPSGAGILPLANVGGMLGTWTDITSGVGSVHQATTDGFIIGTASVTNGTDLIIYSDSSNPPTTIRCEEKAITANAGQSGVSTVFSPVRKNDYYEVGATGTTYTKVYFIALGS